MQFIVRENTTEIFRMMLVDIFVFVKKRRTTWWLGLTFVFQWCVPLLRFHNVAGAGSVL